MVTKIEHIGIAVKDLEQSIGLFEKLLGCKAYKREVVESEGVETVFFQVGEVKIELLGSVREGSAVDTFISKRGEGIHHLAFEVENIEGLLKEKETQGFTLIHQQPKAGADNKKIAFLHPKSTNGVLVEFCEDC